mmetsp:Transcript_6537/g.19165  ORF Transcript_6537/g.19165 Transcript_6537/m.19165 type:complete len:237 (+) Transcript_6537:1953-2663(+)
MSARSTARTTSTFMERRTKLTATSMKPTPQAMLRSVKMAVTTVRSEMQMLARSRPPRLSQRKVRARPKPTWRKQPPKKKRGMMAPMGAAERKTPNQSREAVQGAARLVPPSFFIGRVKAATWCPGCPPSSPTTRFARPSDMNSLSRSRLFFCGAFVSMPAMLMSAAMTQRKAEMNMRMIDSAVRRAATSHLVTSYIVTKNSLGAHVHAEALLSQGGFMVRSSLSKPMSRPPASTAQ